MLETPTLESLDTKLTRLISEWRDAQASPIETIRQVADRKLAEMVAFHPELVNPCPEPNGDLVCTLIGQLLELPEHIEELQADFDFIDQAQQAILPVCSIAALEAEIFKDKEGNPRQASNERERELALNYGLMNDKGITEMIAKRAERLRALQAAKNQFEAARLLVQLVTRGDRK